ncbi:MAG: hypothetical protein WCG90_08170 [Chitinophagia bacterium]
MGLFVLYLLFGVGLNVLIYYFFTPRSVAQKSIEPSKEVVYVPIETHVHIHHHTQEQEKPIDEEPYRNPIKPHEQRIIDQMMDGYLERHPNSQFFVDHPEYVESYLSKVDISELGLDVQDEK